VLFLKEMPNVRRNLKENKECKRISDMQLTCIIYQDINCSPCINHL